MDDARPSMELVHSLPALVAQFKALRQDMAHTSKLYESLLCRFATEAEADRGARRSTATAPGPLSSGPSGMRGSIFTPFSNGQLDPRASDLSLADWSSLSTGSVDPHFTHTRASRHASFVRRQTLQGHRAPATRTRPETPPAVSSRVQSNGFRGPEHYTVMWMSGECGISLRNFSRKDTKVGAQIAVLQHAEGVTTGISNCRLGDQLVTINDARVDAMRFRDIVDMLKTTRRPIALGFWTNANLQTSPRASTSVSRESVRRSFTGGARSSRFVPRGGSLESMTINEPSRVSTADRHSVSGGSYTHVKQSVVHEAGSDGGHETMDFGDEAGLPRKSRLTRSETTMALDRSTVTSVQSSPWTVSDDLEIWCREQEEMHSVIIVLLTETVMRCEKLQQENLDQLQNLMQLSASHSSSRDLSDTGTVGNVEAQFSDVLDVNAVVPAAVDSSHTT